MEKSFILHSQRLTFLLKKKKKALTKRIQVKTALTNPNKKDSSCLLRWVTLRRLCHHRSPQKKSACFFRRQGRLCWRHWKPLRLMLMPTSWSVVSEDLNRPWARTSFSLLPCPPASACTFPLPMPSCPAAQRQGFGKKKRETKTEIMKEQIELQLNVRLRHNRPKAYAHVDAVSSMKELRLILFEKVHNANSGPRLANMCKTKRKEPQLAPKSALSISTTHFSVTLHSQDKGFWSSST